MERDGTTGPEVRVLALQTLEEVRGEMRTLGVHPGGIAIMAPKGVFRLVKVRCADPRAANIVKQEMLARGGDAALAAAVGDFSLAPTDFLLAGTLSQYAELIEKLYRQPYFGLPHLAAELGRVLTATTPGWRSPVRGGPPGPAAPAEPPPFIWGDNILTFEAPRLAVRLDAATRSGSPTSLAACGADLILLDAPGPPAERLPLPAIVALPTAGLDTAVAEAATVGRAGLVLVHTGVGDQPDLLGDLAHEFYSCLEKLQSARFPLDRVALDPGLGNGKTPEQTREILTRLRELRSLGRPLHVTLPLTAISCDGAAADQLSASVALAIAYGANILGVPQAGLDETVAAARLAGAIVG